MTDYDRELFLFKSFKNYEFIKCDEYLFGLSELYPLTGQSIGMGGALLYSTKVDDINFIIKIFSTECPFSFRKGERRPKSPITRGKFEMGFSMLLTTYMIEKSRNITLSLGDYLCDDVYGYKYEDKSISLCSNELRPLKKTYPIPHLTTKSGYPFNSFRSQYQQHEDMLNSPARINTTTSTSLNDIVLILVSRLYTGDLEQLIGTQVYDADDWLGIIFTIIFTLLQLDQVFGTFYHGDFGPRNILYQLSDDPKFTRYIYKNNNIDIPNNLPIIKLWDFDTSVVEEKFFTNNPEASIFFDYLNYEGLHEQDNFLPIIKDTNDTHNDVFILFNRINQLNPNFYKQLEQYIDPTLYKDFNNNTQACKFFMKLTLSTILTNYPNKKPQLISHTFVI